ncbi:MAG: DHH family phosphoesterase, partial [Lachnospiraceae bacterium]
MNRTKWMVQNKSGDFLGISEKYHIDKVTARLLRNRDVITDEQIERFLYGDITKLHDGATMKDMKVGTAIIKEKIKQQKKIRIIGDYDIDGVTATYILYQGITACGGQVTQSIPDRITDGYGLNVRLIEQAAEDGVDTIITCDNGIAAMEA